MSFPLINSYEGAGSYFAFGRILDFMNKMPGDYIKFFKNTPMYPTNGSPDMATIEAVCWQFYNRSITGEGSTLMSATASGLPHPEYFKYRFGKRILIFKGNLTRLSVMYYSQYLRLLELEQKNIQDPTLSEKISRAINRQNTVTRTGETTDSQTENSKRMAADTTSNTATELRTVEVEGSDSSTDTTTTTKEGSGSNENSGTTSDTTSGTSSNTSSGRDVDVSSNMPQSNVSAVTAGIPDNIPQTYASQLSEHKSNKSDSGTTSGTANGTSSNSGSSSFEESDSGRGTHTGSSASNSTESASNNNSGTYNSTITNEGTIGRTSETSGTETGSGSDSENVMGRHESEQELLSKAYDQVLKSNAFKQFADKLDDAFEYTLDDYIPDETSFDPEDPTFAWGEF